MKVRTLNATHGLWLCQMSSRAYASSLYTFPVLFKVMSLEELEASDFSYLDLKTKKVKWQLC